MPFCWHGNSYFERAKFCMCALFNFFFFLQSASLYSIGLPQWLICATEPFKAHKCAAQDSQWKPSRHFTYPEQIRKDQISHLSSRVMELPISITVTDSHAKLSINLPLYFITAYHSEEVLIGQLCETWLGSILPEWQQNESKPRESQPWTFCECVYLMQAWLQVTFCKIPISYINSNMGVGSEYQRSMMS